MHTPNFNLNPYITLKDGKVYEGCTKIVFELKKRIKENNISTVVFDYYHGVDETYIFENILSKLEIASFYDVKEVKYPEKVIVSKFHNFITDHRCNGVSSTCSIEEFFDSEKVDMMKKSINENKALKIIYGVGASSFIKGDLLIYCDIEMEEIKSRYRKGLDNWGAGNYEEDFLRKEKRFMFLEARVQDKHKRAIMDKWDYYIDANIVDCPKMITKKIYDEIMNQFVSQPFQCVPFFAPGVWGGHWLQEKLGVDATLKNTAWGMTGIMEWQSVQAKVEETIVRMPGKNVYFSKPLEFLGGQNFFMYGYKVPLTLDILDTWGGENLSLQCHPTAAYNHDVLNWPYGHSESYYILDATPESGVYLGLKEDVTKKEFIDALNEAQKTGIFEEEKWVNKWPMKKHDHVFIPSGTIHCSAKNTLVLEINTFWVSTFKLWDWGRVDFDGKPRPIDIDRGECVIQERYKTSFVKDRLISKRAEVDRGYGWVKEHSGLMEYEPLRVERYWFEKSLHFETKETLKAVCLVEGEEAIIVSPNDAFEPLVIHYAEPIFVPANVGQFYVKPHGNSVGKKLAILEIYQDLGSRY